MRYAFVADIHGNLDAFEAVLRDLDMQSPDRVFCLGDIVGYGAQPRECIAKLTDRGIAGVAGNHDLAVSGLISLEYFNDDARRSAEWTRDVLAEKDKGYLAKLPLAGATAHFSIAHGTLHNPGSFEYIFSLHEALQCFAAHDRPLAFVAHSHVPMIVLLDGEWIETVRGTISDVPEGARALVNVGAVGQPRDSIPLACYCLYDSNQRRVELRRVPYDIDASARKILEAGLPAGNARRLYRGA